ncbi:hypothetical protein D9619_001549 [Psilocybe cf. subviscida]|uniref:DUF6533 domain-containing protein n=1 Tax=Psilocybe cf. subviscida TaxID=2480587 RepID=A0A8H5F421_9AGAR|nr:hypothetical protein D9619_001549 [Psilocybe cf. subviscida]
MPPFALDNIPASPQPLYSPYASEAIAIGAQAVNRSSVASLTFLVWDILITFDDEVKHMWARSWSYTKVTYFIIRYLPMLVQISTLLVGSELTPHFHFTPHDCFIWQVYQGVASVVIIALVDIVLVLRVHALYHGDRRVRVVVGVCFLFEIAGMISGLALTLPGIQFDNLCVVTGVSGFLIIYGASSIIFQFLLFGLTLIKFVQAVRAGWGDVPLIKQLARDGTWAFFLLFIAYVGQLGLYGLKNHNYAGVLYGWLLTAFSFCGYRVLLNLHHLAEQAQGASRSSRRTRGTDTNVDFTRHLESTAPFTSNFELSMMSSDAARTFGTSQISTLSLGK